MTRLELTALYDQLKKLESQLKKHGAPKSMISRAHDCRLAVSWEIDYRDDE